MRRTLFFMMTILLGVFCLAGAKNSTEQESVTAPFIVLTADIEATISPAQEDYLNDALREAESLGADMLLLRIDTPGGLGSSMRAMVQTILNSPIPVAVWVGPAGARAASAGMFIVGASDVAGMSPTATIGAASPVSITGKDVNGTMAKKVQNDILSLVRAIAKKSKRNVKWYEEAVEESVSITGEEALKLNVVEYTATDIEDFIRQIAVVGVPHKGEIIRFDAARVEFISFEAGARHTILSWLLSPQVAYMLLLGGIAGLFFEMTTPGVVFPGVFGGLCLLLALYALAILPTNAAGVLLILFAVVLFILEIFVTSYGLLAISGLAALFFGSTILFRFEYGFEGLPLGTVASTVGGVGVIILLGLYLVAKAQRAPVYLGPHTLVGKTGKIRNWNGTDGQILIRGEIWSAHTMVPTPFKEGDEIIVAKADGLILTIEEAEENAAFGLSKPDDS